MGKFDMYAEVTKRIIDILESGKIPWEKPWIGSCGAWSRATGKPYALINQFMLDAGEYVTFKQMAEEGGRLVPDADGNMPKAKQVWEFYYAKIRKEEENADTGEAEERFVFLPKCKYINVYNVATDTTLEVKHKKDAVKPTGVEPIEALENIRADYVARSGVGYYEEYSNAAFYTPMGDFVKVPEKSQYNMVAEFYSTVFHELAHSTGHPTRLNRFSSMDSAGFGSEDYSREELVAELTACSVLSSMGVETSSSFRNNAGYIQSWVQALKEDTKAIVRASAKAEAAYYLIMGLDNPRAVEPSDEDIKE